MGENENFSGAGGLENKSDFNETYLRRLDQITELGQNKDLEKLAELLELPLDAVRFSEGCVESGIRKGSVIFRGRPTEVTHFTHMARVALAMKSYFPEDSSSRTFAMVHDTKEEAASGKELKYLKADEILGTAGVVSKIELLTEEVPDAVSVESARALVPADFDPVYVAKYRNFIRRLREHWGEIGRVELCDRLEGASSFEYLNDPQYSRRKKQKTLETFGRIWATIEGIDEPITLDIKTSCRPWFEKLDITEHEVEISSRYFL